MGATPAIFSKSRAFTLIELLVTCGLFVLVGILALQFLLPALRISTQGMVRVSLEQEAISALNRLTADLQTSIPGGVTVSYTAPTMVAINPYQVAPSGAVVDGTGQVIWEKYFQIFYVEPTLREFRRRRWPALPPLGGDPALPSDLNSFLMAKKIPTTLLAPLAAAPFQGRVLAHDVQSLKIEPSGLADEMVQPLKFTLTLERQEATGQTAPIQVSYFRSVFMAGSQ